jgi:creatinine amidohydrolase
MHRDNIARMAYADLTALTWPEAKALADTRAIGLIPTAAIEQHGPHLPLSTDFLIAVELGKRIGERVEELVVVAPPAPGGLSDHHLAFPGTVSLAPATLAGILDAYLAAFERMGISHVAIFSSHGGNFAFLAEYGEQHNVPVYADLAGFLGGTFGGARAGGLDPPATDAHAGGVETSMALALFPHLVGDFDGVHGLTEPYDGWLEDVLQGIDKVSPIGVLGDVTPATAAAGEAIFESVADLLAGWLVETFELTPTQARAAR